MWISRSTTSKEPFPSEFGFCTRLHKVFMGISSYLRTQFAAPVQWISSLTRNMQLVGSIPQEFGRLPFLQTLWVGYTDIGGEIPDLRNSTALQSVVLSGNVLIGSIPTYFFPSSLETLDVSFNCLTGPIPRAFGNFSNLSYLDVSYNDTEGAIPREIAFCKMLQSLFLGGSSILRGPMRSSVTGSIPKELGQLQYLQFLVVESTQVSGMIPSALGNGSSMIQLLLDDNNLSGDLPTWLANMTNLQTFSVSSNRLLGPLSTVEWNKCRSLQDLTLSRNNLSGYIPESLGMASLALFMASDANLRGTIPRSFQNCSNLALVDLQNNQLSGDISDALDVLSNTASGRAVRAIMLSATILEGSLPPWIGSRFKKLFILVLAGNLIQGSIPSGLSQLPSLQEVRPFIKSKFIFRIPNQVLDPPIFLTLKNVTTGLFGVPSSMTILDLSNNNLQGEIPPELSRLVGLRYLNLSGNHLDGSIPRTLFNLSSLIQMDLSNNSLSSSIPSEFANLLALDYVDFSDNHLSGLVPFSTRFGIQSYLGDPGLCGEILNISCSLALSPQANLTPNSSYVSSGHPDAFLSWPGFSIGCAASFLIVIGLFLSTTRGLYFIFGDTEPPIYILKHGLYRAPL